VSVGKFDGGGDVVSIRGDDCILALRGGPGADPAKGLDINKLVIF